MLIVVKRRAVEYFIVFGRRWLEIAIRVCNFPKCLVTTGKFNFGANAQKSVLHFALLYYWKIVENECFALLPVGDIRE